MLLTLCSLALAGKVFVNGVDVGDLRGQTFENATVFFDSGGNVHISAPGYQIQVVDAPGTTPAPVATPEPEPVVTTPPRIEPTPQPAPPAGPGIGAGHWWLVTEDSASIGHSIEVLVNGASVHTVRSGDAQLILDIGAHLVHGSNQISMRSVSSGAGGGTLYVYIGPGRNEAGTVILDAPEIQLGLGGNRTGPYNRDYTLEIP